MNISEDTASLSRTYDVSDRLPAWANEALETGPSHERYGDAQKLVARMKGQQLALERMSRKPREVIP